MARSAGLGFGSTGKKTQKLEDFAVLQVHIASRSFPERSSLLGRLARRMRRIDRSSNPSPLSSNVCPPISINLFPVRRKKRVESAIAAFSGSTPIWGLPKWWRPGPGEGSRRAPHGYYGPLGETDKFEEAPKPYIREISEGPDGGRDVLTATSRLHGAESWPSPRLHLSRQFAEGLA